MKIYVISLKDSVGRRNAVKIQLDRINCGWEFIDAVDGRKFTDYPPEFNSRRARRLLGYDMTSSEVACFLSHRSIWKILLDNKSPGLIFEDDFVLKPHFNSVFNELDGMIEDYGFIRLQALSDNLDKKIIDHSRGVYQLASDPLGATAYALNYPIAEKLFNFSTVIPEPLDHFIANERRHKIKQYSVIPYPVDIKNDTTTITNREGRKPIRGIPKLVRSLWRLLDRTFSSDPWF